MMVYSLAFLVVAILAMVLGWQGFASAAGIVGIAFLALTLLAGSAVPFWQQLTHRRPSPPV